jgi:UDP-N-acetyl-D-glucosamine dehydrogenase
VNASADGPHSSVGRPMKLVVVGQGYVGLPIAMRAVEVGYDVTGFDTSAQKIHLLKSGSSYVEDVHHSVLQTALASGRYAPTFSMTELHDFDFAVITVPTPLRETLPDLSHIENASRALAEHLTPGATVVLESTTYPGTTEELVVPILEAGSQLKCGVDFYVGYSPERIDPGNAEFTFVNTPKVVSGLGAEARRRVVDLYSSLVDTVVPVSTPKEAELTKLLENTFRHVNIALVNELAVFAKDLDIDLWEAIDAASTKPFGYMRFTPGPGVGGHCLPVDPSYLSWQVRRTLGHNFRFVELANDVNNHMPDYVVRRLMLALNEMGKPVSGSTIVVAGLAYKRNTSDYRESPALRVVELLETLGADLRLCDPHILEDAFPSGFDPHDLTQELIDQSDAVLILTDHDAFDYSVVTSTSTYVLDTRHRVSGPNVEHL